MWADVSLLSLPELCDLSDLCVKFCAGFCFSYSLQEKKRPRFSPGPLVTRCDPVDYWTVMLIGAAAGVAAGVVVTAMVDEPATVKLSEPLCDASVVVSPR